MDCVRLPDPDRTTLDQKVPRPDKQASDKEKKRERISLQGRLHEKKEIIREYDRTHQYGTRDNKRKRDENNLS